MLGDVGQPELVGGISREVTTHQIIVDRRSWLDPPPSPAGEDRRDAVLAAQAMNPVLAGADAVFSLQLVGDEPVAEHRVIGMDLKGGVDQVGV